MSRQSQPKEDFDSLFSDGSLLPVGGPYGQASQTLNGLHDNDNGTGALATGFPWFDEFDFDFAQPSASGRPGDGTSENGISIRVTQADEPGEPGAASMFPEEDPSYLPRGHQEPEWMWRHGANLSPLSDNIPLSPSISTSESGSSVPSPLISYDHLLDGPAIQHLALESPSPSSSLASLPHPRMIEEYKRSAFLGSGNVADRAGHVQGYPVLALDTGAESGTWHQVAADYSPSTASSPNWTGAPASRSSLFQSDGYPGARHNTMIGPTQTDRPGATYPPSGSQERGSFSATSPRPSPSTSAPDLRLPPMVTSDRRASHPRNRAVSTGQRAAPYLQIAAGPTQFLAPPGMRTAASSSRSPRAFVTGLPQRRRSRTLSGRTGPSHRIRPGETMLFDETGIHGEEQPPQAQDVIRSGVSSGFEGASWDPTCPGYGPQSAPSWTPDPQPPSVSTISPQYSTARPLSYGYATGSSTYISNASMAPTLNPLPVQDLPSYGMGTVLTARPPTSSLDCLTSHPSAASPACFDGDQGAADSTDKRCREASRLKAAAERDLIPSGSSHHWRDLIREIILRLPDHQGKRDDIVRALLRYHPQAPEHHADYVELSDMTPYLAQRIGHLLSHNKNIFAHHDHVWIVINEAGN